MKAKVNMSVFLSVALSLFSSNAIANPLDWANGEWGIAKDYEPDDGGKKIKCEGIPLRVTVDKTGKIYTSQHGSAALRRAKITKTKASSLTIQYENETRMMDNGQPHIWHMVFLSEDSFVWVREDWIVGGAPHGSTPARVRCDSPNIA